jgi:hypothetical protein
MFGRFASLAALLAASGLATSLALSTPASAAPRQQGMHKQTVQKGTVTNFSAHRYRYYGHRRVYVRHGWAPYRRYYPYYGYYRPYYYRPYYYGYYRPYYYSYYRPYYGWYGPYGGYATVGVPGFAITFGW